MTVFVIGDTVRLKSGGPLMTVTELGETSDPKRYVYCTWFKSSNEIGGQYFPSDAVQKSEAL